MNANHFDVIVIGVGSMGSSACYFLAKQGLRILGLEQFTIPNDSASHSGQSRIIRKAYFEHPDYVPLLQRAYDNWDQLEKETVEQVYFKTGLLYHGPKDHPIIKGVKQTSELHKILLQTDLHKEQFEFQGEGETLFEPDAGFLLPHKAIELYAQLAKENGAMIQANEKIISWKKETNIISVVTDKAKYSCHKLVITAGAWTGKVFPGLSAYLKISRQLLIWMKPEHPEQYQPENFPCWLIADTTISGAIYGFPWLGERQFGEPEGLKAAIHYPGMDCDPDSVNRNISEEEKKELLSLIRNYLPGMKEVTAAKTCLYSNSPDENFIIDFLPGYEDDVVVACGFSGHGFKFVSVIGEILSDLVTRGKTEWPIGFLGLDRLK